MALEPVPITATVFPRMLIEESQAAECRTGPLKLCRPLIFGPIEIFQSISRHITSTTLTVPSVENSAGIDEKVAIVTNHSFRRLHIDMINTRLLIPNGTLNFGIQLYVFGQIILLLKLKEIPLNLWPICIKRAPRWIGFEAECIRVRWNVAGNLAWSVAQ